MSGRDERRAGDGFENRGFLWRASHAEAADYLLRHALGDTYSLNLDDNKRAALAAAQVHAQLAAAGARNVAEQQHPRDSTCGAWLDLTSKGAAYSCECSLPRGHSGRHNMGVTSWTAS